MGVNSSGVDDLFRFRSGAGAGWFLGMCSVTLRRRQTNDEAVLANYR